jgi:signal peptidase I
MSNFAPWLVVLGLVYLFVDNPLQPPQWRAWRRRRKDLRRKREQERKHRKGPVRYWIEFVGSMVLFLFFFRAMVVEAYRIPTGSMEKTLLVGDFLLVNKFVYGMKTPDWIGVPFTRFGFDIPFWQAPPLSDPSSGDIVVFRYPDEPSINYIKRLIAGPGSTVEIRDKRVYIDGEELPPLPGQLFADRQILRAGIEGPQIWPRGSGWNKDQYGPLQVPARGLTIELSPTTWRQYRGAIGNEGHQLASLPGGKFAIDGQPATSYTFEQDHYFMLGDNRDRSADSRYWGFLPRELVVGKAWIIYFSFDREAIKDEFWKTIRFWRLLNLIN